MNRKQIDEAILNAIETLKQKNRPLTPVNIQDVSDVKIRLYQIYNSKLKGQLEIRGMRAKKEAIPASDPIPKPVVSQGVSALPIPTKTTDIDLFYKLFGNTLTIELKEATPDSIDDAIEDLTFLFKKAVGRLQREKGNLT